MTGIFKSQIVPLYQKKNISNTIFISCKKIFKSSISTKAWLWYEFCSKISMVNSMTWSTTMNIKANFYCSWQKCLRDDDSSSRPKDLNVWGDWVGVCNVAKVCLTIAGIRRVVERVDSSLASNFVVGQDRAVPDYHIFSILINCKCKVEIKVMRSALTQRSGVNQIITISEHETTVLLRLGWAIDNLAKFWNVTVWRRLAVASMTLQGAHFKKELHLMSSEIRSFALNWSSKYTLEWRTLAWV